MASVDPCHADLGLAAVPCPDEVLTQLQKVSVATLFQILNRLGFQRTYVTGVSPRTPAWSKNCGTPSRAPRSLPVPA